MRRITHGLALALLLAGLLAACGSFKNDAGADGGGPDASTPDATSADAAEAAVSSEGGGGEGGADSAAEAGDGGRPCSAASCPPVVMANDLHFPVGVALDATHLYWIEAGNGVSDPDAPLVRILKSAPCLKSTDPCRGVLDPMAGGDVFQSLSLAVGPDQVCYTQTYNSPAQHSVYCIGFGSSGGKRAVYQGNGAAAQIVATPDTIAWADFGQASSNPQGAVFAVPADAGFTADAQALASGRPGPSSLAVDGPALFWAEYGTTAEAGAVQRASPDGGPPSLVAGGQMSPDGVAAYGGYAYWVSAGDGTVRRAKEDGSGAVETLASGENVPVALAVDASGVYWIDVGTAPDYLDGALRRVDLAGGTSTTMMAGIVNVQALAIDDADVYVCNAGTTGKQFLDGTIWRMNKTY